MRALLLVASCVLAGCAVDCSDPNWRQRGYDDGFGGHPEQDLRIARYCPGFSRQPYLEGWRAGYDEWYRMTGSMGLD